MSEIKLPYLKYSFVFLGFQILGAVMLVIIDSLIAFDLGNGASAAVTISCVMIATQFFMKKINRTLEKKERRIFSYYLTSILTFMGLLTFLAILFSGQMPGLSENIGFSLIVLVIVVAISWVIVIFGIKTAVKLEEKRKS